MPRGRHRHSPPLHRLLPPSAIAGVSVVCALGPWAFSEATVLRTLAAAAAATAVVGAVVMRRWDTSAGKQVADLTRARASDEWRSEERVAELETDLEESRELRTKLEQRLRAKRAELAGLRNEHAALLRRYATAETERASALEGRRLLEMEAAEPSGSLALPPARSAESQAPQEPAEDKPGSGAVFSPEGSRLYLRAAAALARFASGASAESESAKPSAESESTKAAVESESVEASTEGESAKPSAEPSAETESVKPLAGSEPVKPAAGSRTAESGVTQPEPAAKGAGAGEAHRVRETAEAPRSEGGALEGGAQEDEAQGQSEAADPHARAAAAPTAPAEPAQSAGQQGAGHFTVPTAVAVVPAAPARPVVEGGFDFFGTQKQTSSAALDSVQNEDLADVVGQEALALHKAETEAQFKPAGAESRGIGQVIDLTAHDETEQIDLQGLRSAAS
ncbi:hypothetical protein [Streptomyces cellostaticus]|uniref:hypothetical protein n=1 Tax=Streptomyces cellostaticus TaxID=67285 RepID=UPI00099E3E86|nr:hypothetical protein [Streptomyces cellostaticus]